MGCCCSTLRFRQALSEVLDDETRKFMCKVLECCSGDGFNDNKKKKLTTKLKGSEAVTWGDLGLVRATKLNMECNSIGVEGAKAFARALEIGVLSKLVWLDLSRNSIGDEGAKALARGLERGQLSNLTDLGLSRNSIGDEGAKALARGLERGQLSNRVLTLHGNPIGDEGARELHKGNRQLPGLEIYGLRLGDITFEGRVIRGAPQLIISFPGEYKKEWEELTIDPNLSTCCVFFLDTRPFNGAHLEQCACQKLYGEPAAKIPWGCKWFGQWMHLLVSGAETTRRLIVVTKNKSDYPRAPQHKPEDVPLELLGRSQKGEVKFAAERFPGRIEYVEVKDAIKLKLQ